MERGGATQIATAYGTVQTRTEAKKLMSNGNRACTLS